VTDKSAQALDIDAVSTFLSENLPGFAGPLQATKFDSGQSNPTFLLTTPSRHYVLRRKPPGVLLKSAHAVDREFRIQCALAVTNVPVTAMHLLCEDDNVIGSAFYVMDYVDGIRHDDPRLTALTMSDRSAIIDELNRVLAMLHDVNFTDIGLADFGPQGNYYERQIGRWSKQYRASETNKIPAMDRLISAVDERRPPDDGQRTLVHGDYRLDNMIFERDGTRCLALLDWELSTIGHPYADLAAVIMQWQMPTGAVGRGLAGVDRSASGLPSDEEFVAQYCDRRGIPNIEDFGFYLAFCFFRMAAIIQGVKKRALDGNASNPEHGLKMGEHVPSFAAAGLNALNINEH